MDVRADHWKRKINLPIVDGTADSSHGSPSSSAVIAPNGVIGPGAVIAPSGVIDQGAVTDPSDVLDQDEEANADSHSNSTPDSSDRHSSNHSSDSRSDSSSTRSTNSEDEHNTDGCHDAPKPPEYPVRIEGCVPSPIQVTLRYPNIIGTLNR